MFFHIYAEFILHRPADPINTHAVHWSSLPNLPDAEGFASPFAGVAGGALLVAGGANFPNKRPWDGGHKVWYDIIYALTRPECGDPRKLGHLRC